MRPPQTWQILILDRKHLQLLNDSRQLRQQNLQAVPQKHQVRIVGDIAACGAPVDDTSGSGSFEAKAVDMRHDVVAAFSFLGGNDGELVVCDLLCGVHLRYCGVGDVEAELFLTLG